MLHQGKEDYFRYDVREILEGDLSMEEETWRPIVQSLYTQGSRNSIKEAKLWLNEKAVELEIPEDAVKKIKGIFDQYATWR